MEGEDNKHLNGIRMCKFLSKEKVLETCSLCGGFQREKKKMNKQKFRVYFKKNSQSKDEASSIQMTNVLTSVTENLTSVELGNAEEEMQKTYKRPKKYQVEIPPKIKKEVSLYARDFGNCFSN